MLRLTAEEKKWDRDQKKLQSGGKKVDVKASKPSEKQSVDKPKKIPKQKDTGWFATSNPTLIEARRDLADR